MRLVARLVWVAAIGLFPILACNPVYTPPDIAPLELLVSVGYGGGENLEKPLEGAQLCETDTDVDNCALSDDRGRVTIDLPVDQEISYTVEKKGYTSYLTPDVIGPGGSAYERGLPTVSWMAEQHWRVEQSPYPMRFTGTIFLSTGREGVTLELDGATGKAFYVDEDGLWNPDLTATTDIGWGGFTEVTPGDEYQVNLGGTAGNCAPGLGWPGDGPNSIRLPVREGYLTRVAVACPTP